MAPYSIQPATLRHAAIIAHHRVAMFRDMGQVPTEALASQLLAESSAALNRLLQDGSYVGWLAVDRRKTVIGGVGAHVKPQLPRIAPGGDRVVTTQVPLVVNVYTEPEWRGQGIARALMKGLMTWAARQGADRIVLHASDAARPLYRSLGFEATNEMRWFPHRDDFHSGVEPSR